MRICTVQLVVSVSEWCAFAVSVTTKEASTNPVIMACSNCETMRLHVSAEQK